MPPLGFAALATLLVLGSPTTFGQQQNIVRIGFSVPTPTARTGMVNAAEALRSEPLIVAGPDGRAAPGLATSWSRSADGRTWTFVLAENLKFHNGQTATSETIARLVRVAITDPEELQSFPGLQDIQSVEPAGDRKLVLRSKTGRLSLLDELGGLSLGRKYPQYSLGPFVVADANPAGFTAKTFKNYFKGPAIVEGIEYRSYRSARSVWAALMRDEVDVLYEVQRDAVEFVERDQRLRVYSFLRSYVSTLLFNVSAPSLTDKGARLAIANAVNREDILRLAYRGRGRVADGPLAPAHWALSEGRQPSSTTRVPRRPADRAGTIRFRCLVPTGIELQPFERIALVLQKQLFDAGVHMELEAVTPADFVRRVSSGQFEAALFEFTGRTPLWVRAFWRSPAANSVPWIKHGYRSADRELDAMHFAETEEEVREGVAAVYERLREDPPAVFIAWPEVTRAVSRRFDVPVERGRDVLGTNLRLWRPAAARKAGDN